MAEDRKQRLKALAARAGRTKQPSKEDDDGKAVEDKSETNAKPTISFRNYAPTDKSLSSQQREADDEDAMRPSAKRARTQENDTAEEKTAPVSSSKALENALAEAKKDPPVTKTASNSVATMAPKKVNWDLKRDIADKLAKLEKRTQKAIVRILKERLESEAAKAVDEEGEDAGDLD